MGAFLTLAVLYFVGVIFLLDPVAAASPPPWPLLPMPLAFAASTTAYILFFDWVAQRLGDPIRAALIIAVSQLLLVDVDYVLSGKRGLAEAAASATILIVSWTLVGIVYDKLSGDGHE